MDELKVGVVGVGGFGELHIAAYQTLFGVEVAAVSDVREERLREVGNKYRIPNHYQDYRELCAREDLHIVSIVTPEGEHVEPALAALRAHKHVFLEKPIATCLQDAEKIIQAAGDAGAHLMVGHILRFENKYATVKRLIDEGQLGKVVSIHARRNRPKRLYQVYGNRVHGMLVNAIHDIDLCLWYTSSRVKKVRAFVRNIQGGKYPDVNWGVLEFENGGLACLETHWLAPDRAGVITDDSMQVIGTGGIANIDLRLSGLSLWADDGAAVLNVSYDAWFHGELRGPLKEELSYFVNCVRKNREPSIIRAEEAVEALKVALALVRSAEENQSVVI